MRFILIIALALSCRLKGNIEEPTCAPGASLCRGDRAYVCGGGYLRPVGTDACGNVAAGVTCCYSAEDRVHACIPAVHCSPEPGSTDAGVSHD